MIRIFEVGSELRSELVLGDEACANIYDDATRSSGEDWIGSFGFEPSSDVSGAAGGGATAIHVIDEAKLGAKFLEKIQSKADKCRGLPAEHHRTPFVVALHSHEAELRPVTVLSTLTGPRSWSRVPRPAEFAARFEAARKRGWEPLLREWGYVGSSHMVFPSHGAFGEEGVSWADSVSGVVVLHDSDTLIQWLPNPFAREELADTRLMKVGLALDILGAPCTSR